ncbi:MAG TPA: PAS domain-containing protein [Chloroflexota bacterium]|nr:PAS domain-containing protein [Chloroflexota bacterium]
MHRTMSMGSERAHPFDIILDSIDDAVAVQGADGRYLYVNARFAALVGLPPDVLLDLPVEDITTQFEILTEDCSPFPPDDLPGRRVLLGDEPAETILGFRRPGTPVRWMRARARPVRDADGHVTAAVNVLLDITARKDAERERALRLAGEERTAQRAAFLAEVGRALANSLDYETTLDTVARLAVSVIADWCIVDTVSDDGRFERVTIVGNDRELEAQIRTLASRYPPDERSGAAAALRTGASRLVAVISDDMLTSVARNDESLDAMRSMNIRSGMIVPLTARDRIRGAITFLSSGPDPYTDDDLSLAEELGRRAALAIDNALLYAQASHSATEMAAILRQMGEGVVRAGPDGRILFVNEAAARIMQAWEPGHDIGEYIEPYAVRRRDGTYFTREELPLARALRGETVSGEEWISRRADGQDVVIQGSATPVHDDAGRPLGAVLTFRDITAQRELDRQKDEFLSLVGHELRTPLTVLHGYLQLLERRTADESIARPLKAMRRQTDQLVDLVHDLLDLSRIGSGLLLCSPEPLDYLDLVRQVVDEISLLHPDHDFRIHSPDRVDVAGDAVRLRQVLINLIDNALKYGPPGTAVTVTIQLSDGAVQTFVCDEGPPLPSEERERVFERFYRLRPAPRQSGLGIGLYITRAIVEAHGGRIWIEEDDHLSVAFSLRSPEGQ